MTASSMVGVRVVDAGSRRFVAVAPEGRPDLRLPQAHPSRPVAPGRVGRVASCVAVRPQPQPRWLAAKVVGLCLLALVGVGVSAGEFASMATPDPAREYVAGHPAWAHVDNP